MLPINITLTVVMLFFCHMTDLSKKVDLNQLSQIPLKQSILIYDDNNDLITHHGNLQLKVKFEELPKKILGALLATEDMHFWSHFGLNIAALAKAVLENIRNKAIVRGGSTITQQLAKNLVLQQDDSLKTKKTARKLLDIILAVRLENCLSKEQIMEHYLNRVYFGRGAYGIKAAAKLYFNKLPDELSIEEVAFLVGLIRAPSLYAANYSKALDRTLHVLRRMYATKQINKQYTKVELEKLIRPVQHSKQFGLSYFVDWVVSTIPQDVTKLQQPILMYTTINQNLQQKVMEFIPKIKSKSRFKFSELAFIGCGLDGAVYAMVGGLSNTSFNRATQAFRQAGSIFKIYTFLCAFLRGLRHTDTVEDTPPTIGDWTPSNYMHREVGFVTLERAFAESINGATVRVAMDCGLNNIVNLARIFGLTGSMPQNCSLILGSASVTLYQIAQTMLILANNGYQKAPYGIREIKMHDGTTVYTYSDSGVRLITDQDALDEMDKIMHSVIQKGTGRFAKNDKYPIRGKTGTSQDYRDLWFASISPFMIACAWCGHDDNSPMEKNTAKDVVNPVVALCKETIDLERQLGYDEEVYELVEEDNQNNQASV